jgi:DinB family protein
MERLEIIERLKDLPVTLEREIEGLSDAALSYRPADGEYSIKETIGHLRDMAEVWHKRLYATASLTDPRWPGFDGEASVRDNAYQDADVRELIAGVAEWRGKTVDLLAQTVDWTRLGQSPDLGRRSFKQWAEFVLDHDLDHLGVIRRLKEAQTAARLP